MKAIPENYLRCMTPEARKSVGQRTAAEVMANGVATSEKALQRQIVQLLRLKGLEVNVSRMDKRKTDAVGWPDLTFSVFVGGLAVPCLWEVKMPNGRLSNEQERMHGQLVKSPNAWVYRVIRSVDQAFSELRLMGIE